MGPGEKPVRRVEVSEPVRPVARKPAGGLRWPGSQQVGSGGQEASRWAQVARKPAGGSGVPDSVWQQVTEFNLSILNQSRMTLKVVSRSRFTLRSKKLQCWFSLFLILLSSVVTLFPGKLSLRKNMAR